jgi:uncharacterized protein (TIGR02145 family)
MKNQITLIGGIFILATLFLITSCGKDKLSVKGQSKAKFNESLTYGTVKDIDGNIYKTIKIGNQIWMAENLRATHYNNGDLLPQRLIKTNLYSGIEEGAYGSYNDTNDKDSIATFGLLYNWYAISDGRGLAPKGWHIPSREEWETLLTNLGSGTEAELKLLESGSTHWYYLNLGNNESGFTALPAGQFNTGGFFGIGYWTAWWTISEKDKQSAFAKEYSTNYPAKISAFPKSMGLSVRCIKN